MQGFYLKPKNNFTELLHDPDVGGSWYEGGGFSHITVVFFKPRWGNSSFEGKLRVISLLFLFVTKFTLTEVMPCSIQGNSWQSTHSRSAIKVTGITVLYCEHIIPEFPIGHLTQF